LRASCTFTNQTNAGMMKMPNGKIQRPGYRQDRSGEQTHRDS